MNRKAFTLVELLAVITILGVLSIIITPKIANTIKESEEKTNMTSVRNLIKAATYKTTNNEITGNLENKRINYTTGENIKYLEYTGDKPTDGQVNIKSNGQVAIAVRFGNKCYLKAYNSDDISVIPYETETCGENASVFTNYTMPNLALTGDGLYESATEPGRYIYRGTNPDNYIKLKENGTEVMYRIISYEQDGTIKVVRNEKINSSGNKWDDENARHNTNSGYYCTSSNGCNVWGNTSNTYYNDATLSNLNQDFYFKYYPSNTSDTLENYTNAGIVQTDSYLNTYLNNTWINTLSFKDKIVEHSWNVGGVYITASYNEKSLEKIKDEEKIYKWNGKIALMTISEYQEASLSSTCTFWNNYYYNSNTYTNVPKNDGTDGTTRVNNYNSGEWPCALNNWSYKNYAQWSLTAYSNYRNNVWYFGATGTFSDYLASYADGVRPTFYLKSSIKLGGFGSSGEPYYITEN